MSEEPPALVRRGQRLARVVFLLLLAGGLGLWAHLRAPRELSLEVDLAAAGPGEVIEADVVVTRDGHALARHDERFGDGGAPQRIRLELRGRPGPAEVEATLVLRSGPARRSRTRVELDDARPAVVALGSD